MTKRSTIEPITIVRIPNDENCIPPSPFEPSARGMLVDVGDCVVVLEDNAVPGRHASHFLGQRAPLRDGTIASHVKRSHRCSMSCVVVQLDCATSSPVCVTITPGVVVGACEQNPQVRLHTVAMYSGYLSHPLYESRHRKHSSVLRTSAHSHAT